jgi:hypothetical protein
MQTLDGNGLQDPDQHQNELTHIVLRRFGWLPGQRRPFNTLRSQRRKKAEQLPSAQRGPSAAFRAGWFGLSAGAVLTSTCMLLANDRIAPDWHRRLHYWSAAADAATGACPDA